MATRIHESSTKTQPEVVVRRTPVVETAHMTTEELDISQGIDLVRAQVEASVKAALDEAMMTPHEEAAEPENWWNLYALGPIQFTGVPGPLNPRQIIKVGETGYVATIFFLNPFLVIPPGVTPASILSGFALPYEIRYQTGNLTTWSLGPGNLNVVHSGPGFNLVPGVNVYLDVIGFNANTPGLYEMNVSARLLGATPPYANAPQFAGFARAVMDIDPDLFISGAPGLQFDQPIRFQVYP